MRLQQLLVALLCSLWVSATAGTWSREPSLLIIAYIAFYVIATALIGLMLGVVLAATAMLVLRLRGRRVGRPAV